MRDIDIGFVVKEDDFEQGIRILHQKLVEES
jgi:aspartokinase